MAAALEARWLDLGHDVRRFGPHEAGCAFLAAPAPGVRGRARHAARVIWFSTVGTIRARRAVRALPEGAVSICHNDALAGDVYVNHGVLTSAMKARGHFAWRMMRNPLHLITTVRDLYRYRAGVHQVVVNLSDSDCRTLVGSYGLPRERAVVIPNGVHLARFVPASPSERDSARQALGIPRDVAVAVFVGHEFERKGLPLLLAAASDLPDHHVVVVGGTPQQIDSARADLSAEVAARVHWTGRIPDPRRALAASDVLVLPSAYEANPLVVLEALASGLQVVATPVGSVPDTLVNDDVARVVDLSVDGVRNGLRALAASRRVTPRIELQARARDRAAPTSWDRVAQSYLDLFENLRPRRTPTV
ncbi:glycosyltransferase [Ornithinimicrobium tianjinense]|uniref:glycosyltransferase n=1 Tax=Ornithinimicrobium tianjinense TaxID=1195761 RepID=UPI0016691EF6